MLHNDEEFYQMPLEEYFPLRLASWIRFLFFGQLMLNLKMLVDDIP